MTTPPHERLYSVDELCEILNAKPSTVRLWLREGRLHGVKLGPKLWRVPQSALDAFLSDAERD